MDHPLQVDPAGLSDRVKAKFPHIANYTALSLSTDADVAALLKCQLALATRDGKGRLHPEQDPIRSPQ